MAELKFDQEQQSFRVPLIAVDDPNQTLVNCYPVVTQDPLRQDGKTIYLQKRVCWGEPEEDCDFTAILTSPASAFVLRVLGFSSVEDCIIMAILDGSGTHWRIVEYKPAANVTNLLGSIAVGIQPTDYAYGSTKIYLSELVVGEFAVLGVVIVGLTKSQGYYIKATDRADFVGGSSVWTEITDVDFPPKATYTRHLAGGFVQLNQVIYVMTTDGYIHGCEVDVNDLPNLDSWNTDGYVKAQSYDDAGVGLIRYKHHLLAFGRETMEFFNDEGLAPPALPIAPTQQAFQKIGLMSIDQAVNIKDTVFFIGQSKEGSVDLYKLDGYTAVRLSNAKISALMQAQILYPSFLTTVRMHGMDHICINVVATAGIEWFNVGGNTGDAIQSSQGGGGTNVITGRLMYCIDTGTWWIWAEEAGGTGYIQFATFYWTFSGTIGQYRACFISATVGTTNYGNHPRILDPLYGDTFLEFDAQRTNDEAISAFDYYRVPVVVTTNEYDFNTGNRKFINSIRLIGNPILAPSGGTPPYSTFVSEGQRIRIGLERTGYISGALTATMAPEVTKDKATTTENPIWHRWGATRKARFAILINSCTPVRLEALEVNIKQGTH